MKTTTLVAFLGISENVAAHYMWSRLLVNGTETAEFQYVRDVSEDPTYAGGLHSLGKIAPQLDLASGNITCGRNAAASGPTTETADVVAGSRVGFRLSEAYASIDPPSRVFHPGPGQVYLSRPPDGGRLEDYVGDGEWFKIDTAGPVDDHNWKLLNEREYNFTIPPSTPPGKYLLRIEQFMPTAQCNYTQWYVNCAHINVIGPGGGAPAGFARFPGTYEVSDPGILVSDEMALYPPDATDLMDYIAPGPAVWTG